MVKVLCLLVHITHIPFSGNFCPFLMSFSSTIVPVPKSNKAKELDSKRIAITSLVMKSFEEILKSEIVSRTSRKHDPLQFAYQTGKEVDDAKIDKMYKHLEKPMSEFFLKISPLILTRCNHTIHSNVLLCTSIYQIRCC